MVFTVTLCCRSRTFSDGLQVQVAQPRHGGVHPRIHGIPVLLVHILSAWAHSPMQHSYVIEL